MPKTWSPDPPTEEGSYWFYGDESFGSMGGNFTGTVPPVIELHYVEIQRISNGLIGVTNGRFMSLRPFDRTQMREGYVGVWKRANLPELPLHLTFEEQVKPVEKPDHSR